MEFGTSLLLVAIGVIMRFAVTATTTGLSFHTVGLISMVVGAIGLVLSMIFWQSWGGIGSSRRTTVVERRDELI